MGTIKIGIRKIRGVDTVEYKDSVLYLYDKDGHCLSEGTLGIKLDCKNISVGTISCVNSGVYLKECSVGNIVSTYTYYSSNNECGNTCIGKVEPITYSQFCAAKDIATYMQTARGVPTCSPLVYSPSSIHLEGSFNRISVAMPEIPRNLYVVQLSGANINRIESTLSFCELSKLGILEATTLYTWMGILR